MQLSLVEQLPELNKSIFLDIYAKMCIDRRTKRPTLVTLDGQRVPAEFKIRCYNKTIWFFPEGTIYKLDVRLVDVKNRRPFFRRFVIILFLGPWNFSITICKCRKEYAPRKKLGIKRFLFVGPERATYS
jgi:hypothetical protein